MKKFILLIPIFILVLSCWPSSQERNLTSFFNEKYKGRYHFDSMGDYYLRVKVLIDEIDSIEIENIYNETMTDTTNISNTRINRRIDIPWYYLNVYSQDGTFLYRLGKDPSNKFFYKEREFD